ncbi:hypothetical protein VCHENC02_0652A, partial [Vibrio harveyi]
MNARQF